MIDAGDIGFYDLAVRENRAWFVNVCYSAIFSFDMNSFEGKLEYLLPKEFFGIAKYGKLKFYHKDLILAPLNDDRVLFYNTEHRKIEIVTLSDKYIPEGKKYNLFSGIEVYKDAVYLFPGRYQTIVKISLFDKSVSYIWNETIKKIPNPASVRFRNIYRNQTVCYLSSFQTDDIWEFDMNTEQLMELSVHKASNGFTDLKADQNCLWLCCRKETALIKYHMPDHSCQKYLFALKDEQEFINLLIAGNYIYCKGKTGAVYKIDKDTGMCTQKFECASAFEKYSFTSKLGMITNIMLDDERIIAGINETEGLSILNINTGILETVKIHLSDTDSLKIKKFIDEFLMEKKIFNESSIIHLKDFLSIVVSNRR